MMVTSRWAKGKVGDVVEDTQYGTSLKANELGEGIPVLRMSNITYNGAFDLTNLKHVELPRGDVEQYTVRRGDLLFNRTNSQELVGKTGVWTSDEPFAFAGYLVRLRVKPDLADPRFLAAWFNTTEMKTLLRMRAKPSINMSNINATEVLKFPVVLPPLTEQRRIAEVLDRAEALRTKRRAALAQLDTLTQSIFLDLFGDPTQNSKGLRTVKLEGLCVRVTDGTHQSPKWATRGVPFLFISNIVDGKIDFDTNKFISVDTHSELTRRCPIEVGDILFTTVGSYGNVAVVEDDRKFAFQRHIAQIKPDLDRVSPRFMASMLTSPGVRRQIDTAARGVAQKTVNLASLKELEVFDVPLSAQQDFARRITAVEKLRAVQRASLAELDALFASLQHRAFRGEL